MKCNYDCQSWNDGNYVSKSDCSLWREREWHMLEQKLDLRDEIVLALLERKGIMIFPRYMKQTLSFGQISLYIRLWWNRRNCTRIIDRNDKWHEHEIRVSLLSGETVLFLKALGLSNNCQNCFENSSTVAKILWVWSRIFKSD
jgi:hypothetical protein